MSKPEVIEIVIKPGLQYSWPTHVDPAALKLSADRRRAALVVARCSTYTLGMSAGEKRIVCLCCGLGSGHPQDIATHYCGFCHAFHSEEEPC